MPTDFPTWEDVEERYRQMAPGANLEPIRREFESRRALAIERQSALSEHSLAQPEEPALYAFRRAIPVGSTVVNFLAGRDYENALERIRQGRPRELDASRVAEHERLLERDRRRGLLGQAASGLAHVPAIVGETALGGAGAAGYGARAATWAGAALPNVLRIPSEAIGNAQQRQEPSSWYEFQNLAPAVAMGTLRTAIYGVSGRFAGPVASRIGLPTTGAAGVASRIGVGTGLGLAEMQAVDAIGGAAYLHNGYGYIGDALQGHQGEAMQHLVVDALTLAAFTAMHSRPTQPGEQPAPAEPESPRGLPRPGEPPGIGGPAEPPTQPPPGPTPEPTRPTAAEPGVRPGPPPNPIMQTISDVLAHLRRGGYSAERAAYLVQREFIEPWQRGLQDNPTPTRDQARAWFAQYPENSPLRRFADQLAQQAAIRPREAAPPETAPESPVARAPAETATAPPQAEIAAPERSQAVEQQSTHEQAPIQLAAPDPEPAAPPDYNGIASRIERQLLAAGVSQQKIDIWRRAVHEHGSASALADADTGAPTAIEPRVRQMLADFDHVLTAEMHEDVVPPDVVERSNQPATTTRRQGQVENGPWAVIIKSRHSPDAIYATFDTEANASRARYEIQDGLRGTGESTAVENTEDARRRMAPPRPSPLERMRARQKPAPPAEGQQFATSEGTTQDLHGRFEAAALTPRERDLIHRVGVERQSLSQAGAAQGISGERVRQILAGAMTKLHAAEGGSLIDRLTSLDRLEREEGALPSGEEETNSEGRNRISREEATMERAAATAAKGEVPIEAQHARLQTELTKLTDQMEWEDKYGRLTDERRAFFAAEHGRIESDVRALEEAHGPVGQRPGTPQRPPGNLAPAGTPNAPSLPAEAGSPASGREAAVPAQQPPAAVTPTWQPRAGRSGQISLEPFVEAAQGAAYHYREMSGQMFPRTSDLNPGVGERLARFVAANQWARDASQLAAEKVLGPQGTALQDQEFDAALWEYRARHAEQQWRNLAGQAAAAGDHAKATEYMKKANKVGTAIGAPGSPLKTAADYQRVSTSPEFGQAMQRYAAEVTPVLDDLYTRANMKTPQNVVTQIPGLPFNARSHEVDAGWPGYMGEPMRGGGGRGNLRNPKLKRDPFAREASLEAPPQEFSLTRTIQYSYIRRAQIAAQHDFVREAVSQGLAEWAKPGEQVDFNGKPGVVIPQVRPPEGTQTAARGETDLVVHPGIAGDVRKALAPDEPWRGLQVMHAITTRATLASAVEAVYHSRNMLTAMMRPGFSFRDMANNFLGVVKRDMPTRERLVDLALIGALKDRGNEAGNLWGGTALDKWVSEKVFPAWWKKWLPASTDPTVYSGAFLDVLQRTMRLTVDDAFQRLVKRGWALNTETNRRDRINQDLGLYHARALHSVTGFLSDSGIGPFAKAGITFMLRGADPILGMRPNTTATGMPGAVGMRAEMLAKYALAVVGVGVLNAVLWGSIFGDDNTPFGVVKIGEDEEGGSWGYDILGATGLTRGMRATGLRAEVEGARRHDTRGQIQAHQIDDLWHSLIHPAFGPTAQFIHTTRTGENAMGVHIAPRALPGDNQYWENFKTALWNTNPVVAVAAGAERPQPRPGHERPEGGLLATAARVMGPLAPQYRSPVQAPELHELATQFARLRDERQRAVLAGDEYDREDDYRELEAAHRQILQIDHEMHGLARTRLGLTREERPSAAEVRRMRQDQLEIAREAIAAIRQARTQPQPQR